MRLLFFIREMEVETRNLSSPEEGNQQIHQLLFFREGMGALNPKAKIGEEVEENTAIQPGVLVFKYSNTVL